MKSIIRPILDRLKIPKTAKPAKTIHLDASPKPPLPADLENQTLSSDPLERLRQIDQREQDDYLRRVSS